VTALRFAIAGWVVPLLLLGLLPVASAGEATWEPPEESEACWRARVTPSAEEEEPLPPPSPECLPLEEPAWHRLASTLSREDGRFTLIALTVFLGTVLNVFAIARGRPLRKEDRHARLGYRLGVLALVLVLGLPLVFGLLFTLAVASFPIRG
jgi:hypothetical protein